MRDYKLEDKNVRSPALFSGQLLGKLGASSRTLEAPPATGTGGQRQEKAKKARERSFRQIREIT